MVSALGHHTLNLVRGLGDFALFVFLSFRAVLGSKRLFRRVVRAGYEQGVRCLPVIVIVGMFTGLVLGLQGYYVLHRFGSESLLGALVSLSLVRELGPVLAALMLVGQAGSALAAELGIHPTQLKEWKKIALQGLPELFSREGKARPGAPDRLKHMSNKSTNCITRLAA